MSPSATFSPGTIISARGREWIVLVGSDADVLRVRPVSGSEADQTRIHLALEAQPVTEASFRKPAAHQVGSHDSALLLRDALLLSLRRGAGPFRGIGQISVEPRAYQLVPLLMALKLDPVRLLIADDVGVGKTIEAGLIARELLDRGDIERTTVLCPAHLVDQWVRELDNRFHFHPVAVTATSARRLERDLPPGESIFSTYAHTVVSLDYIKSETRRSGFLHACPELVIVDEAHTCATARGRHQRYELLAGLAASDTRHMLLLTATPHSGDEAAFYRLLGLLHPDFEALAEVRGKPRDKLRERLALHFVQRRRPDIVEWQEGSLFPRRETKELTYRLSGVWERFFTDVLDYCASVVQSAEGDALRQRLNFWSTLALMRCVASSPAAAVRALRTRAGVGQDDEQDDTTLADRIFDGRTDLLIDDDVEPPVNNDDPQLNKLIKKAEALTGKSDDPKLALLTHHLGQLLKEGFNPVVFCRYIATAHYLGRQLAGHFDGVTVSVVTGEQTSEEREEKVELLADVEQRLLIATDCLSEGVNLQEDFDSVVHYDLSWNPTRHEQREGRVDRFGQRQKVVRTTLMYGANNPVDGAVLEVILRKAAKIREELGVPVPLPDDGHTLTQALMRAVFLRHDKRSAQQAFDFSSTGEAQAIDATWQNAADKAKKNRTVFAQRRLKPEEVLPEWHKTLAAIGARADVYRFAERALARLGSGLEPMRRGFKAPLQPLPQDVRERLEAEGLVDALLIDFDYPAPANCRPVQRSHPLISILAETLLERTLADVPVPEAATDSSSGSDDPAVLGRVGCWVSDLVTVRTTVALLRLRHQLSTKRANRTAVQLVEEAAVIAWAGATEQLAVNDLRTDEDAIALLTLPPVADPPAHVRTRMVSQAVEQLAIQEEHLNEFARQRARILLADHRRVREASVARGSYSVKPLLPADVIGLFVILPRVG